MCKWHILKVLYTLDWTWDTDLFSLQWFQSSYKVFNSRRILVFLTAWQWWCKFWGHHWSITPWNAITLTAKNYVAALLTSCLFCWLLFFSLTGIEILVLIVKLYSYKKRIIEIWRKIFTMHDGNVQLASGHFISTPLTLEHFCSTLHASGWQG